MAKTLSASLGDRIHVVLTNTENLQKSLIGSYNHWRIANNLHTIPIYYHIPTIFCTVAGITENTYGKFQTADFQGIMVMEYKTFMNKQFKDWYGGQLYFYEWFDSQPNIMYDYASYLVYQLPEPRYDFYLSSSFSKIQENVLEEQAKMVNALGIYPVSVQNGLLSHLKTLSLSSLFLGLIFYVVLLLFMVVSILLIYSLLMIIVEEKAFDSGLMRMMGLSKRGYVYSILF